MRHIGIAIFALTLAASTSFAHYNVLLPDKPWANKDEKVAFTYQFGHPYEHELFDAPKPAGLVLITPKGEKKTLDIDKTLTKIELPGADGKKVTAWQFVFTPTERGDYAFVLKTPKIKIDNNEFVEDTVRVVLHVQTQNGWDKKAVPFTCDILTFTRPYGLLPGMAVRAKLVEVAVRVPPTEPPVHEIHGVGDAMIEIEKYNEKPMKVLPPDELITFRTKADVAGYFLATLPETGWWGVTGVIRNLGEEEAKGPVTLRRATLWVHVDEKK